MIKLKLQPVGFAKRRNPREILAFAPALRDGVHLEMGALVPNRRAHERGQVAERRAQVVQEAVDFSASKNDCRSRACRHETFAQGAKSNK